MLFSLINNVKLTLYLWWMSNSTSWVWILKLIVAIAVTTGFRLVILVTDGAVIISGNLKRPALLNVLGSLITLTKAVGP